VVEPAATTLGPNAIGATLGLLGDEWSLLIVRHAFTGVRTYGGFRSRLGISDSVLSSRLAKLTDAGVLARTSDEEYVLSRRGEDLWRLMLCIWAWEQHYVVLHSALLPRMVHTSCGKEFQPVLCCAVCAQPVTTHDVDARFGPSGSFSRSAPVGATRRRARRAAGVDEPGLFPETMAIIGSRWSSAILGAAFLGASRFGEFERLLGAPPSVVAERLKSFVQLDVLRQDGAAYVLTAKGHAFFPVVASFLAWGERWMPAPDGPAIIAVHKVCGQPFIPQLACSRCPAELLLDTMEIRPPRRVTPAVR
jgi:DNA-binding HxlR family transcriptional regulator